MGARTRSRCRRAPGRGSWHRIADHRDPRRRRPHRLHAPGRARRRRHHATVARSPPDQVIDVDLALAFTTGMVATVNPCGFAMLPAYLSFFLGVEDERASVSRAFVVGATVTVGAAATFAVAGLAVTRLTNSVYEVAAWGSIVIGALLAALGVARVAGLDLSVRLPRLERGGRSGGLNSMALFGVSYAVASIGCELPGFLGAMSGAFNKNLASGVVYFT